MWLNIHGSLPPHTHPQNSLLRVLAAPPASSYLQSGPLLRQRGGSKDTRSSCLLGYFDAPAPSPPLPPLAPSELGRSLRTRGCPQCRPVPVLIRRLSPTRLLSHSLSQSLFLLNIPAILFSLVVNLMLVFSTPNKVFLKPIQALHVNFFLTNPTLISLFFFIVVILFVQPADTLTHICASCDENEEDFPQRGHGSPTWGRPSPCSLCRNSPTLIWVIFVPSQRRLMQSGDFISLFSHQSTVEQF